MNRILFFTLLALTQVPFLTRAQTAHDKADSLIRLKMYHEALEVYTSEISRMTPGRVSTDTLELAPLCKKAAKLCLEISEFGLAESYYRLAEKCHKGLGDEASLSYGLLLYERADLYQVWGRLDESLALLDTACPILSRNHDTRQCHAGLCPFLRGYIALTQGLYDEALPKLREAVKAYSSSDCSKDPGLAHTQAALAYLYTDLGAFDSAVYYYRMATEIFKSDPAQLPEYANMISSLGEVYFVQGDYQAALRQFNEAREIMVKEGLTDHSYYMGFLTNVAVASKTIGRYDLAEPMYLESISLYKKSLGEHHPLYAKALNNLAMLYLATAEYDKAEPIIREAVAVILENFGTKHKESAAYLSNQALLYHSMGNFAEAEKLYISSLQTKLELFGKNHQDYMVALSNLAQLYSSVNDFRKAETLLKELVELRKEVFGADHEQYAFAIYSLGMCYYYQDSNALAEPLISLSYDIRSQTLGEMHPHTLRSLTSLGALHSNMGRYAEAERELKSARDARKAIYGSSHPDYIDCVNNLGKLYIRTGRKADAEACFTETNALMSGKLIHSGLYMNEKERELYLNNLLYGDLAKHLSFFLESSGGGDTLTRLAYDNALQYKGVLLSTSVSVKKDLLEKGDSISKYVYERYMEVSHYLSKMYALPLSQRWLDTDSLEREAGNLQKQLLSLHQGINGGQVFTRSWKDVQQALSPEEAAVEWIRFRWMPRGEATSIILYCALILRPGDEAPVMIRMFKQDELSALLDTKGVKQDYHGITTLYASRGIIISGKENAPATGGDSLYALVWKPMEIALKGVKRIYLSPVGLLNRIAFDALPVASGKLLSDVYDIRYVSSTANLTEKKNYYFNEVAPSGTLLAGGFDYGLSKSGNESAKEGVDHQWVFLPGTLTEVNGIAGLIDSVSHPLKLWTGKRAGEKELKMLSGRAAPGIMHLATHGFYVPADSNLCEPKFPSGSMPYIHAANPLLRSGIVMAGAN